MKDKISLQKILSGASLVVILLVASLPAGAADPAMDERAHRVYAERNSTGASAQMLIFRSKYIQRLNAYICHQEDMYTFATAVGEEANLGRFHDCFGSDSSLSEVRDWSCLARKASEENVKFGRDKYRNFIEITSQAELIKLLNHNFEKIIAYLRGRRIDLREYKKYVDSNSRSEDVPEARFVTTLPSITGSSNINKMIKTHAIGQL